MLDCAGSQVNAARGRKVVPLRAPCSGQRTARTASISTGTRPGACQAENRGNPYPCCRANSFGCTVDTPLDALGTTSLPQYVSYRSDLPAISEFFRLPNSDVTGYMLS